LKKRKDIQLEKKKRKAERKKRKKEEQAKQNSQSTTPLKSKKTAKNTISISPQGPKIQKSNFPLLASNLQQRKERRKNKNDGARRQKMAPEMKMQA
jgi:hypothetical protein